MKHIILVLLIAFPAISFAQNVGIGTTAPNANAALDISSSNKGILIPRISSSTRTNMVNPTAGLLVYDTDAKCFYYHDGISWVTVGAPKTKSIYISANSISYNPSATITPALYGLNLANTASQVAFVIPKPVDWDSTRPFTITLHFSLPTNTTNTFIQWRLTAGGMVYNNESGSANTGWDSYNYYTNEDASLLVAYASASYTNLSKAQTWTPKFSTNFNTWYFGANNSVTVANSFSGNPIWRFGFQRGASVANGETYSGNITINAVTITYPVK